MTGNIKLGHYPNAAVTSIGNNLAHLVLRVEETIGSQCLEPGKFSALDAETLILCQVPVKDVQLYCRHRIEITFEDFQRFVVAADIDEQASPWEKRVILNLDTQQIGSVAIAVEQLQEGLQAA